eukprot:2388862-Amphidinium_carterae.1
MLPSDAKEAVHKLFQTSREESKVQCIVDSVVVLEDVTLILVRHQRRGMHLSKTPQLSLRRWLWKQLTLHVTQVGCVPVRSLCSWA